MTDEKTTKLGPRISIYEHRHGTSYALVPEGLDLEQFWRDVDGYEGSEEDEFIEAIDLPMPYAAAPSLLGVAELVMRTEAKIAADRDYPTVEQWNAIVKAAREAVAQAAPRNPDDYCPKCGEPRTDANTCPDDTCGWNHGDEGSRV